jgi:UDP-arabinose 4-epimerase
MGPVIVTGGAGYIGSHACKHLHTQDIEPVCYDNLMHGHRDAVRWGPLVVGDIRDQTKLRDLFAAVKPKAVIHFAGFAYVGESVGNPGRYYDNNVAGTIALLEAMRATDVKFIVFSSSCATYGIPSCVPIAETENQMPINPYGRSKLMVEQILADYSAAHGIRHASLRYFNAAGADPDGELGERHDPETHVLPRALMAAAGLLPALEIFGDDYSTPDGTCVRDYIHVSDLADAHVRALNYLLDGRGDTQLNLGSGEGVSIRELVAVTRSVTGRNFPTVFKARRPGDPPVLVADTTKAAKLLGFTASRSDINTIVETAWRFLCEQRTGPAAAAP